MTHNRLSTWAWLENDVKKVCVPPVDSPGGPLVVCMDTPSAAGVWCRSEHFDCRRRGVESAAWRRAQSWINQPDIACVMFSVCVCVCCFFSRIVKAMLIMNSYALCGCSTQCTEWSCATVHSDKSCLWVWSVAAGFFVCVLIQNWGI